MLGWITQLTRMGESGANGQLRQREREQEWLWCRPQLYGWVENKQITEQWNNSRGLVISSCQRGFLELSRVQVCLSNPDYTATGHGLTVSLYLWKDTFGLYAPSKISSSLKRSRGQIQIPVWLSESGIAAKAIISTNRFLSNIKEATTFRIT